MIDSELELVVPIDWSPKQWAGISFRPPRVEGRPPIEMVGFLGQYGGGKTCGAGGRFGLVAFENPFDPTVHAEGDHPMSGLVAPTMSSLYTSTLPQLRRTLRPELILRERLYPPHQDVMLINGHLIKLYTAEGAIEGPSLCQLWVDECQLRIYEDQWVNLIKRVRDVRARRLNFQVSGLATYGAIEEQWRRPVPPNQRTILFRTTDNARNLAAGYVDARLGAMPASDLDDDGDGWTTPSDLLYAEFSEDNLRRAPPLAERFDRPTHVGVDLRIHSAVVFTQDEPIETVSASGMRQTEVGQLIVGEMVQDHQSAETIATRIRKETRWKFEAGVSEIAMDPTASMDEVNCFRKAFPGCRIVQHRVGPYLLAENGQRAVKRALRDGAHNVRLYVHPSLSSGHPRGVVRSLRGYREKKLKDGVFEHMADAIRYIEQVRLPIPGLGTAVIASVNPEAGSVPAWRPI